MGNKNLKNSVKLIRARFSEKIRRTDIIFSFRFIPEEPITFKAGQFLQVIFDEKNQNNKELNKYLSFSSAPGENYFEVTKKLSESLFSQKLKELKINDEVYFRLPFGECVLEDRFKKIGFLIGGIGITPVISMVKDAEKRDLKLNIIIFYSSKSAKEFAFKEELDNWQKIQNNFKVVYAVSEEIIEAQNFYLGRIDKSLITKEAYDYLERTWYLFGPPQMVEAMEKLCLELGIDKKNILTEKFLGY